ncbi:MAG: hypothetical protein ABW184_03410 [Sphingobium sp.]
MSETGRPKIFADPSVSISGGHYGELSAAHLSVATTRLLDLWAGALASEAPVLVAGNVRGWFVATLLSAAEAGKSLPEELGRALDLARDQRLDFLFFHCDAPIVDGLRRYDW